MEKFLKFKKPKVAFPRREKHFNKMFKLMMLVLLSLLLCQENLSAKKQISSESRNQNSSSQQADLPSVNVSQQTVSVSGRVTDVSGLPLPGVTVLVKGKVQGTITDNDGNYSLSNVPSNSLLVFSFVGMKTIEMPVSGKSKINVTMEEESIGIGEVVAIGYGTLSKKEISSSIVNVSKSDFQKGAVSDPMELVIGKVAGLNIDESSSSPHSSSNFQIRGATSITAGNSPLVVIDGVAGGNMNNLASQDIESITVLKDGASAAIYGTRGANGVILITTKQGAEGNAGTFIICGPI